MEVLYPRCAGLDVHKDTVVACVRCVSPPMHQEVRSFRTTTRGVARAGRLAGRARLHARGDGGDRRVLEAGLARARRPSSSWCWPTPRTSATCPGRKTDVNDAIWIADLLAHGLIRCSFVPPQAIQELRDLTRTRKQLVREIAQHTLRIQKVLEDANIKLGRCCRTCWARAAGRCSMPSSPARATRAAGRPGAGHGAQQDRRAASRRCAAASPTHHRSMLGCTCR